MTSQAEARNPILAASKIYDDVSGFKPLKSLWLAAYKKANGVSPLDFTLFKGRLGCTVIIFLQFALAATFITTFAVQVATQYPPTEANGGRVCTTGATQSGTCEALAVQELRINSGCLSFSIPNDYTLVTETFASLDIDKLVPKEFQGEFELSITEHRKIWDCFTNNSMGQVLDPDLRCVAKWSAKNWMGLTDYVNLRRMTEKDIDALSDEDINDLRNRLIPYAIRVLYSLFSTSCLVYSAFQNSETDGFPPSTIDDQMVLQAYGAPDDYGLIRTFQLCGCQIQCPPGENKDGETVQIGGASDPAHTGSNSLGDITIAIPHHYIDRGQTITNGLPDDNTGGTFGAGTPRDPEVTFPDKLLPMEGVAALGAEGQAIHCPSATIMVGTPSTLRSGMYRCCVDKSIGTLLAEGNAFAGLATSIAAIFTALLFSPLLGKDVVKTRLKAAVGAAGDAKSVTEDVAKV